MSEKLPPQDTLEERRVLVDINRLVNVRQPDGTYPPEVLEGIYENLVTKVQEDSMSAAVSITFQPVGEYESAFGEKRRTFVWKGLGYTALQVAESGYAHHRSDAAIKRVKIEVKEAEHSERNLKPGIAQVFISPKMSRKDAPLEVARDEHLADDDAVRISRAVTDADGVVIGRRTGSLLVRDIPLEAWVAMLRDENNIFGRSIDIQDDSSALSVMSVFAQLDIPEELLPEGPVTLVTAVKEYIKDTQTKSVIEEYIDGFRQNQQYLRNEAERKANEWLEFEKSMADSLANQEMTFEVRRFVIVHQQQWPKDILSLLKKHENGSGYSFSNELAKVVELAWQKVNLSETSVLVGDKKALKGVDPNEVVRLQNEIAFIRSIELDPSYQAEAMARRAVLNQYLAVSNVKPGGGCGGVIKNMFDSNNSNLADSLNVGLMQVDGLHDPANDADNSDNEGIGKKHIAKCRTDGCPSRPGETEVGGCDVCLKWCQPVYNEGNDPAELFKSNVKRKSSLEKANRIAEMFGRNTLPLFNLEKTSV